MHRDPRKDPYSSLRFRLGAILVLTLAICLFFNAFFYIEDGYPVWMILVSNLAFTGAAFESTRFLVVKVRTRIPSRKRFVYIGAGILLISLVVGPAHLHFEKDVLFRDTAVKTRYDYISVVGSTIFFTMVIAAFYEAVYFFRQWDHTRREKEQLSRENLETRYELLKNQVQPHFLFNSLNTLTALVDEDPEQARAFIRELALVYRHLLQSNEQSLIPLEDELQFIRAYFFLLKTRFGESLALHIDIASLPEKSMIPPLTLQILVENAVKHNRTDREEPLRIDIAGTPEYICVQNNLLPKTAPVISTGLGLLNVVSKYRLLGRSDVTIQQTNDHFLVTLPVLHPQKISIP